MRVGGERNREWCKGGLLVLANAIKMQLDNVEVHASPHFMRASCPKGHGDMLELPNGWFSVCWYCEKCGYPYQLQMMKMRVVNKENLAKVLAEEKAKHEKRKEKA